MSPQDKLQEILEGEIDRYYALREQRALAPNEVAALEKLVNTFAKLQSAEMKDGDMAIIDQMTSEELMKLVGAE